VHFFPTPDDGFVPPQVEHPLLPPPHVEHPLLPPPHVEHPLLLPPHVEHPLLVLVLPLPVVLVLVLVPPVLVAPMAGPTQGLEAAAPRGQKRMGPPLVMLSPAP
jgi:hypothetical protein